MAAGSDPQLAADVSQIAGRFDTLSNTVAVSKVYIITYINDLTLILVKKHTMRIGKKSLHLVFCGRFKDVSWNSALPVYLLKTREIIQPHADIIYNLCLFL